MIADLLTIAPGITLEYVGDIPLYTLHPNVHKTVERSAIDAWIDHALNLVGRQPGPLRLIYDFSQVSVLNLQVTGDYDTASLGLTTDGNRQVEQIFDARPQLKLYLGIVMSATASAKVSRAIAPKAVPYTRRFWVTREAALKWLHQTGNLVPTVPLTAALPSVRKE